MNRPAKLHQKDRTPMSRADFSANHCGMTEADDSIPFKCTTQNLIGSGNELNIPVLDDRLPDLAEPQVANRISINQQVFESMLIV